MAEKLLQQPPLNKGFPLTVVGKPFWARNTEVYVLTWPCFKKADAFKEHFAKYAKSLSSYLFDTKPDFLFRSRRNEF